MKFLLLCCFLFFACMAQAKQTIYLEDEYKASLKAWKDLKSKAYTFVIVDARDSSVARTTIKVRNGRVVSRKYLETAIYHYPSVISASWSETTPETLGSHEAGYPVVTFDEVYADCLENILTSDVRNDLRDPSNPQVFGKFIVDDKGLLSMCAIYHEYGLLGNVLNVESIKYC